MIVKFKIILEDGTFIESHDENWNEVKTHAHALPPYNIKKWHKYELITNEGQFVSVDFRRGLFCINGQLIHPADKNGLPLTDLSDLQDFPSEPSRKLLNNMPYYPIFGRTRILGNWGEAVIHFCGWKRKQGQRTIQKIAYIYPNGQIVLT